MQLLFAHFSILSIVASFYRMYKHYPNRPEKLTKEFAEQELAKLSARIESAEKSDSPQAWLDLYRDWNSLGSYYSGSLAALITNMPRIWRIPNGTVPIGMCASTSARPSKPATPCCSMRSSRAAIR